MNILLGLLMLFAAGDTDVVTSPSPAVAGKEVTFSIPPASGGRVLSLASPFGAWQKEIKLTSQKQVKVLVPKTVPLLLAAIVTTDSFENAYSIIPLVNRQGKLQKNSDFWQSYLLGGFPSPFPVVIDQKKALALANKVYKNEPGNLPNLELLWRLQAKDANDKNKRDAFLDKVDSQTSSAPSGRIAMAAATVHVLLGDPQGASVINSAHTALISPVHKHFQDRWMDIITTSSLARRTAKLHLWMEEDPFNPFGSQAVQILAATYSARNNYLNTARFGMLSLLVIPDDAMTLNGVAMAMAEGNFQLERGLVLSERAISILSSPDKLKKPAQLTQQQWSREINSARGAAVETKAWLLAKLKRYALAKQSFELSASMHPTDELYMHFGQMLAEQKKYAEARTIFNKGIRLNGPMKQEIKKLLQNLGK